MSKDELKSGCCLPHILVRAGGSGCVLSHELHLYWITWKPHVSSSVWMSTGPSQSIKTRSPVLHKNKAAGSFQRSRGKLSCSFCLCLCLRGPYVITGALSDSSTHTSYKLCDHQQLGPAALIWVVPCSQRKEMEKSTLLRIWANWFYMRKMPCAASAAAEAPICLTNTQNTGQQTPGKTPAQYKAFFWDNKSVLLLLCGQ